MAELLLATTAFSLIAGSFAAFGLLGASSTALLAGTYVAVLGHGTDRLWMSRAGTWLTIVAGFIVTTLLVADSRQFAKSVFHAMRPFVGQPKTILIVSGVLIGLAIYMRLLLGRNIWPLIGAACAWLLFAIWEHYCNQRKFNIRVDLIFIAPSLFLMTLWGFLSCAVGVFRLWRQVSAPGRGELRSWQNDSDQEK
jgi:hypothetical protein